MAENGPYVTLLFSIVIPDSDQSVDPEMAADEFAAIINEERRLNAGLHPDRRSDVDVTVGLFPAAQWLTAEVLAELRQLSEQMQARNAQKDPEHR